MERKIGFLIWFVVILSTVGMASEKDKIYEAYISGNMALWKETIDKMEKILPKSNASTLELVNYQYGYIGWAMGSERQSEARQYLRLAEAHLDELGKRGFSVASVQAYQSAMFGFRIGLNRLQAPILGPKSVSYSKNAIESDPENPLGYIQLGNAEYYMPAAFGGSKKKALEYYLKARALMEKQKSGIKNDWNYLNLLTLIGQAYIGISENGKAKKVFEEILRIEPNFLWVKNELSKTVE